VAQVPKAVVWYKVYCYLFALLNYFSAWEAFHLVRDPYGLINTVPALGRLATDQDSTEFTLLWVKMLGWSLFAVGVVFGTVALSLPQAPDNRKTWVAHLVHLAFGATSCVLTPLCVPLLIAWFRPEVKAYFDVK
jgi:hypothetical protein